MGRRVLVVDDMVLYRTAISAAIRNAPDLHLVGTAHDGEAAITEIRRLQPDIVVLDLEMPGKHGLDVLRELQREPIRPLVIVFSAQSQAGADSSLDALSLGASDFCLKPTAADGIAAIERDLIPKILALTAQREQQRQRPLSNTGTVTRSAASAATLPPTMAQRRHQLLVIASSTGGPKALEIALRPLPATFAAPILVIQHMPPVFTTSLSQHLDSICPLNVVEAQHGMLLKAGVVYIAPGDYHLVLRKRQSTPYLSCEQSDKIMGLRPAADVTLRSLADHEYRSVIAVFTGMGRDGTDGIKALAAQQPVVLSQSEASCVVYGMPESVDQAELSHGHFTPETFAETLAPLHFTWG